jgi:hypothetical protein
VVVAVLAGGVAVAAAAAEIGTDGQALKKEKARQHIEHRVGYISPPVFFFEQQESAEGTGARTWVEDRVEL